MCGPLSTEAWKEPPPPLPYSFNMSGSVAGASQAWVFLLLRVLFPQLTRVQPACKGCVQKGQHCF